MCTHVKRATSYLVKIIVQIEHSPNGSVTMSISSSKTTFKELELMFFLFWWLKGKRNSVFANSLMGTTIQDGGMREKSSAF